MEHTHETPKVTPQFFFASLGVLASLVASVVSFLSLVFETLNHAFPDVLSGTYSYDYESMRSSLAVLIILFPAFLILSRVWTKMSAGGLSRGDAAIKRWMIYLVLFLASLVVVIDLVTLVRYFISGEITVRFITKVIVMLGTSALLGGYYFRELSKTPFKKGARAVFAIIASVLVLASVICSFTVMGSPTKQRGIRLDDQRVQDLQSIQSQVITYWQEKDALPVSLASLSGTLSDYSLSTDPESGQGKIYEYSVTGDMSFQLCATFALPSQPGDEQDASIQPLAALGNTAVTYPGSANDAWNHDAGHACFSRTIDPAEYPLFSKTPVAAN